MPFLHVHARVLNFTSFGETPGRLDCLDASALARSGQRAKLRWAERQAEVLRDIGYRAGVRDGAATTLRVDGVCARLVAAIEAPRIAVLRILERALVGDRPPNVERLGAELPPAVIAAMAEQLESLLARSFSNYRPAKIGIPSQGPWRSAVREHLSHCCPGSLEMLDDAARRARATPIESPIFPTPQIDSAHCHAPDVESLLASNQMPADPELGAPRAARGSEAAAPAWLVREFSETLLEVNERNVRFGPDDPLVSLRGMLAEIDQLSHGADPVQLRQAGLLIGEELERRARGASVESPRSRSLGVAERAPLASLEELLEGAAVARLVCEQEIGGRSL
jgi:hypothetical protein